jgi:DNA primase
MYKDFATNESGDVIKFVQEIHKLNYNDALNLVWKDMVTNGAGRIPKPKYETVANPPKKKIEIKRKNFTKTDDEFWGQFGIDRDLLKRYFVYPISAFWVDGVISPLKYTQDDPMYAYKIFNKFKIYKPLTTNKLNKWRTNCTAYDIQGFQQLPESGDLLIITKSLKDVMVLTTFGYTAVAAQSETSNIPRAIFEHLQLRFKKIIIFFDNDFGGQLGAKKLCKKFDINSVFISKHYLDIYSIKDISDFRREMSVDKTKELLKELFDEKKT